MTTLLTNIGSVFVTVSFFYKCLNKFFTDDIEDLFMINKAYTYHPQTIPLDLIDQSSKTDKQVLLETLKTVSPLNFNWKRLFLMQNCACCTKKNRLNKIFEKGEKKLFQEMDIVRHIKQLRTAKLTSEIVLKPYQRMLVEWLADYRLSSATDQNSSSED